MISEIPTFTPEEAQFRNSVLLGAWWEHKQNGGSSENTECLVRSEHAPFSTQKYLQSNANQVDNHKLETGNGLCYDCVEWQSSTTS